MDSIWNNSGDLLETLEQGMIVILDPGHFSVDWVVINQQALRKNASGTSLEAMSSLIEKVSQIIKERKGATISHSRIEEAIKNKKDKR